MRGTLKRETRTAHSRAESLAFQKLLTDPTAHLSPQLLRHHIACKRHYVGTLEAGLVAHEASFRERSEHLWNVLQCLKALFRSGQLDATAAYLDSRYGTSPPDSLPAPVLEYAAYLRHLATSASNGNDGAGADSAPATVYLLFHAWVHLCDGIFGGIIIAEAVAKRLGEGAAAFVRYPDLLPPPALGEPPASFARQLKSVMPWYVGHFQVPLEAYRWRADEVARAVSEANTAFEAAVAMGQAMGPLMAIDDNNDSCRT